MADWQKVESLFAPLMGYLGASDPQQKQNQLQALNETMNSLRQMQQTRLEIATTPYDVQYKQSMGGYYNALGKKTGAEADKIQQELANAPELQRQLQFLGEKLGMPDIIKVLASGEGSTAVKGATDMRQFAEAEKAGTFGAEAYQKAQEANLGGQVAKQAIIQRLPEYETGAKVAESQATMGTAIPSAQEKLATDIAKRKQEEQTAMDQSELNKSLMFSRYNTSSGASPDSYKQIYTEYRDAQNDLDSLNAQERGINSILARIQGGASSNDLMGFASQLGVSLPNITGQDENTAKNTISSWATTALADIQNRKKAVNYIIGSRGQSIGVPKILLPKPEPDPTGKPLARINISKATWDVLPIERQKELIKTYPAGVFLLDANGNKTRATQSTANPTAQPEPAKEQPIQQKAKPQTQPQPKKTGNDIKMKPKPETEKKYSEMSTDELYRGVGNSTKMK